jgi:hypothetical protein
MLITMNVLPAVVMNLSIALTAIGCFLMLVAELRRSPFDALQPGGVKLFRADRWREKIPRVRVAAAMPAQEASIVAWHARKSNARVAAVISLQCGWAAGFISPLPRLARAAVLRQSRR